MLITTNYFFLSLFSLKKAEISCSEVLSKEVNSADPKAEKTGKPQGINMTVNIILVWKILLLNLFCVKL